MMTDKFTDLKDNEFASFFIVRDTNSVKITEGDNCFSKQFLSKNELGQLINELTILHSQMKE